MRLSHVLVVVALVGCTREKKKEPRFDGPMPVAFGDCAGAKTTWVSGPKPFPFTPEEANSVSTQDPPPVTADKDDPPPPPDDDVPLEEGQAGGFASLTGTGDVSSGFDDSNIYGGLLGNEAGEMNGGFGFGRSGFGPGGSGDGWGTIGTGKYGTIGHGSGTGYGVGGGRGGLRGRSAAVPTVSIGQPNAQGDLDKAIIRRYIKRNVAKITYCYEKQLLVKPKLSGTVQTQFFITANGNVASASASGVDPNVADCVAGVIKNIEFPKPKGGGGVQVNYPFTFRPAGDDGSTPSAPADPIAAGGGSDATGSAAPVAPPKPPPPPPTARELFRAHREGLPQDYVPGAANPLAAQAAAIVECLRKGTTHNGVIVVDLTYDAQGKATNADPHGLSDERARKCFIEAAKKVTHAGAQAERCSLSFGEMPITSLPSIDITADAISFGGKALTTPKSLMSDDAKMFKIDPLYDVLETKHKQSIAAAAPAVAVVGPIVIKPIDSTPMKVVMLAVTTALGAGEDVVLASAKGTDWTLVTPMTLPAVPVPLATGGVYNRVKPFSFAGLRQITEDDEHVTLSVYVMKDKVWLGISRVNEFQEVPRDASFEAQLVAKLAEYKKSAFFTDRSDIEIAGDNDVPYSDVLLAIRAANAAKFTDWRLALPSQLAARPQL